MFKYPWRIRTSQSDAVSWTDKPVDYYIYTIQRTKPSPPPGTVLLDALPTDLVSQAPTTPEEKAVATVITIFGSHFPEEFLRTTLVENDYDANACVEKLLLLTLGPNSSQGIIATICIIN
jgi:hypothetical protein